MNRANINKNISKLEDIIKNNGVVTAPTGGILAQIGIEEGRTITGGELVSIAVDKLRFKAEIPKESSNRLSIGDDISIQTKNDKDELSIPIESIGFENADGIVEITGTMPGGDYSVGAAVKYVMAKTHLQMYAQTIPIQALRQNTDNSYYVLATEERNTILGDELLTVKRQITLLDKDYTTAAVEGGLSNKDNIIISSNKNINDGDRVRINE